ncbi:hypothetical protein CL622_07005 [archaeon]|nr:hypothetical protein [archaeon]|tara:strand:- start:121 stop:474 length:354 start_codon:yes stop_codon:yes gene_type:complete
MQLDAIFAEIVEETSPEWYVNFLKRIRNNPMKTDYKPEIREYISKMFEPSEKSDKESVPISLDEFYVMLINVLPSKWVYKVDVHDVLQELNFKTDFYYEGDFKEKPAMCFTVKPLPQ